MTSTTSADVELSSIAASDADAPQLVADAKAAAGDASLQQQRSVDGAIQQRALLLDGDGDGASDGSSGGVPRANLRRSPVWGTAANSIAFMCVPRSIPACFAATGWSIGMLSLVYSSVVTYDTGMLLGGLCLRTGAGSFPALAGEAAAAFSAGRGGDGRRQRRWRRLGGRSVAAVQHATYYLTGVSELIYFEQYMGQLFAASPLCQWQWLLLVSLACLPVLQVPSFHAMRFAALVFGVLPLGLNVAIFLYEVLLVAPWECAPGPRYTHWPSPSRAAVGLTAFAYAYGGHGLYPEMVREMAQPARWPAVVRWTYGVCLPLYWGVGLLGYYAYGDAALANINLNFPDNLANRLSIGVQAAAELFFVLDSDLVRRRPSRPHTPRRRARRPPPAAATPRPPLALHPPAEPPCAPRRRRAAPVRAHRSRSSRSSSPSASTPRRAAGRRGAAPLAATRRRRAAGPRCRRGSAGSGCARSSSPPRSSARSCSSRARATRSSRCRASPAPSAWSPSPTSCRTRSCWCSRRPTSSRRRARSGPRSTLPSASS